MASIHGIDRYTFDRYFTAFLNSIKMTQINFCVTLFPPLLPASVMECTNVLSAKKTIVIWHEYDYIDTDIVVFPFASLYCDFPDDYNV